MGNKSTVTMHVIEWIGVLLHFVDDSSCIVSAILSCPFPIPSRTRAHFERGKELNKPGLYNNAFHADLFFFPPFSGAFMGHSRTRIAFWTLTTTRTLHCSCSIGISNRLPQEPWSVLSVDPSLRPAVPCGFPQSTVCGLVRRRAVLSVLAYPRQTFGCARVDGGWDGGRWRCCFPPKVLRSGVPKTA